MDPITIPTAPQVDPITIPTAPQVDPINMPTAPQVDTIKMTPAPQVDPITIPTAPQMDPTNINLHHVRPSSGHQNKQILKTIKKLHQVDKKKKAVSPSVDVSEMYKGLRKMWW